MRTVNLAKRPLLRDDPGAWSRILEERRHLYEGVADVTFRTDRTTKESLTRLVVAWLYEYGSDPSAARFAEEQPAKPQRRRRRRGGRRRRNRGSKQ